MAGLLQGNRHPSAVVTPLNGRYPGSNPATFMADLPDCAWGLILLAAVVMVLDGSVSSRWLVGETGITEEDDKSP